MLLVSGVAHAQQNDPTIMTINGQPVSRSEFEYSYNKNNSEGVIDKKSVADYVDLFINYKLKVAAAYDAKVDTLRSFKKEFRSYRDQQVLPSFASDEAVEAEAKKMYSSIIIDTVDGMADLAAEFVCGNFGVARINDGKHYCPLYW